MRDRDKKYFLEAAHKFNAWIIVRLTNPKSMQYIGMPGYWPKRIDCGACIPVCPTNSIFILEELPDEYKHFADINAAHYN